MALVPTESSFLTSLNADRKRALGRQKKREELLQNTESGEQILKLFGDLQGLADDLDERVEGKLSANEKAFFVAYKSFMYTVQKEFKELKQKADEEETKTRRDAKIQSLEKELDWFMNEALRLDELCKKYKKELDKWKGKAEALEDDRQFLENQIKQAKRNNKSLRGAVEQAQSSAYSALVNADDSRQQAQTQDGAPGQHALEVEDSPQGQAYSGLSQELEERYQATVKSLKLKLVQEQRSSAKMRAVADRQFGEPSELEAFFLDCVDKVKETISHRKKAAMGQGKAKTKGYPEGAPQHVTKLAQPATLDDFTVTDRRKVVELLLSSEQVLQFLYDKLFPQEMSMQF
mmetsp:Transcript_6897/g.12192  ORF Transcript_6897/g.12192 Transcript_6897/m.12192 type:complete len:347 (-) Transcript_6897:135-1175(-)|eukprot:CAMPEP_0197648290 /NCGR_PEP_ID=MMETSP1338-20131121/27664_1 /TAXON_ID=43686 ORGANISM="Pelagodinium beii, Strain RCC1491" /NCGR_SAMPLE_ID=MMETSP1338 /ASSEMBLY_ACC=CAM_ASM_000754 /LENGTH=346 /DNA_ID=CAMNT_0043222265 /DNA_START=29 /DNA_END=1069 /DNA_ORIENTATION=+